MDNPIVQLPDDVRKQVEQATRYLRGPVYTNIGVEAVRHFKQSFHDEGFSDKSEKDMTWDEVKRTKKEKKNAYDDRKILTGETGELGSSISYQRAGRGIVITSPKVYAQVHNEGGHAGRGAGFTMKKRQFIGPSEILDNKIQKKIEKRLNKIFK